MDTNMPHDQYLVDEALRAKLAALQTERDLIDRAITVLAAVHALQKASVSATGHIA